MSPKRIISTESDSTIVEAPAFSPYEHEWDGDLDKLHGFEDDLASENTQLAQTVFADDSRAAFEAGWVLGYTFPPPGRGPVAQSGPNKYGPMILYGKETPARRIYFLELVAWAIYRAESFQSYDEARVFGKELTDTRKQVWGEGKPWRGAAHSRQAFLDHVGDMADVFAHSASPEEAKYPNRTKQPLG